MAISWGAQGCAQVRMWSIKSMTKPATPVLYHFCTVAWEGCCVAPPRGFEILCVDKFRVVKAAERAKLLQVMLCVDVTASPPGLTPAIPGLDDDDGDSDSVGPDEDEDIFDIRMFVRLMCIVADPGSNMVTDYGSRTLL